MSNHEVVFSYAVPEYSSSKLFQRNLDGSFRYYLDIRYLDNITDLWQNYEKISVKIYAR